MLEQNFHDNPEFEWFELEYQNGKYATNPVQILIDTPV